MRVFLFLLLLPVIVSCSSKQTNSFVSSKLTKPINAIWVSKSTPILLAQSETLNPFTTIGATYFGIGGAIVGGIVDAEADDRFIQEEQERLKLINKNVIPTESFQRFLRLYHDIDAETPWLSLEPRSLSGITSENQPEVGDYVLYNKSVIHFSSDWSTISVISHVKLVQVNKFVRLGSRFKRNDEVIFENAYKYVSIKPGQIFYESQQDQSKAKAKLTEVFQRELDRLNNLERGYEKTSLIIALKKQYSKNISLVENPQEYKLSKSQFIDLWLKNDYSLVKSILKEGLTSIRNLMLTDFENLQEVEVLRKEHKKKRNRKNFHLVERRLDRMIIRDLGTGLHGMLCSLPVWYSADECGDVSSLSVPARLYNKKPLRIDMNF